jgi:ribonuclease-3
VTPPPETPPPVAGTSPDLDSKPRHTSRLSNRSATAASASEAGVAAVRRGRRTAPVAVIDPEPEHEGRTRREEPNSASFEKDAEERIGVSFHKTEILRQAFVHRSYMNEYPSPGLESNERLEFFGDAVLSYVVAERLFRDNPGIQEGELTEWRGYLVKRDSLAAFARKLGLGPFLLLGHGEEAAGGRDRNANLACLFEAVVGAIAIDRGMLAARGFILRAIGDEINLKGRPTPIDPKSRLQEVVQSRWQRPPSYHTVHEEGPEHRKVFTVEVSVHGQPLGSGIGPSKQEAERNAARAALVDLQTPPQSEAEPSQDEAIEAALKAQDGGD